MPRRAPRTITFTIDGREVQAPENTMLVDAAKLGDVEIPVFCYEPKLGQPSAPAACASSRSKASRSCRPAARHRSRTAWSCTPQTERVKTAQQSVVEFLLINHPLDCPVCDKGGECPLQDITFGWGGGHLALHRAQAPLRQAARALAADRDRPRALHPLLPLRALLPGGRRGLPAGAARARRALLRLDLRRASLRGAVQRQHHRAVPRRRAHLAPLPLPGAPVGHRGRGLGLHALPRAVQRDRDRPRRARAARPRAARTTRSTTAGCATRAASPTSPSTSRSGITEPMLRDGGAAAPRLLGARARGGRRGAAARRRAHRRDRRRADHRRGGAAARAG